MGKVMELLVTIRSRYEAETRRLISENQAGFRNGCSTEDQLLSLPVNHWRLPLQPNEENRFDTHDLSSVYDHVWPDALLLKMPRKGVSPHQIQWIQAWLANRQRCLVAPNTMDPGLASYSPKVSRRT